MVYLVLTCSPEMNGTTDPKVGAWSGWVPWWLHGWLAGWLDAWMDRWVDGDVCCM